VIYLVDTTSKGNKNMGMYKNELAQVQAAFDSADTSVKKSDGSTKKLYQPAFPVGEKAQAVITSTRIGNPPWPGDDRIFLSIELTHPISDRSETMWIPLVNLTERAAGWVKSQLKKLGYDTDVTPISEIEDHMDEWIGLTVEIFTKRNDRGKVQYYLNHIVEQPETSGFNAASDQNADDDIPF
jgi:hypothetical protein